MLFLEIALTCAAWRKGWGALALVPLGTVLLLGFLMGVAVAISGGEADAVGGLGILVDLIGVGALGAMIARAPRAHT